MSLCKNTNHSLFMIFTIIYTVSFTACISKTPLVKNTDSYHQSPYGAYIEVRVQGVQEKLNFKGELIAVDNKKVVIRTFGKVESVRPFALKDILSYEIYYAKNDKEDYNAWNILLSIGTISHGFLAFLTLPINGIILGSINKNKKKEFSYTQKDLPISEMSKFSRYPQGLPPNINLNNLIEIMAKKEINSK